MASRLCGMSMSNEPPLNLYIAGTLKRDLSEAETLEEVKAVLLELIDELSSN